jgi:uncharacterized membrane protein YdjX (TVP38/TMEM64 family)
MRLVIRGHALAPRHLVTAAIVLVFLGVLFWFRGQLDLKTLHDHANEFSTGWVLAALTILPLLGFPVSVMHAVTGAKFGLPLGMTFVGVSIAVQLVASYGLVRLAPEFFAKRLAWLRRRLPPATHRPLTLFTLLLPGAPYFAQNYVLAVMGVPFRIFFCYAFPINFGRSLVGVIFGEWSGNMTPARIAVFVVYTAALMLFCGLAFRRLRAQLRSRRPGESDLTQSAPCGHAAR